MFYPNKIKFFILILSLQSVFVFANGGGEEKKEEGKEGGEAAAPAEVVDKAFSQAQLKVQNLSVRQEEYKKQIDELTEKRRHAKSKAEQQALRQQMVEIEKTSKKEVKELEELKIQLQYRYPDLGEKKQREYAPDKRKPSSEPNSDGLKDVLNAAKRSMDEQYGNESHKESSHSKKVDPKPSRHEHIGH